MSPRRRRKRPSRKHRLEKGWIVRLISSVIAILSVVAAIAGVLTLNPRLNLEVTDTTNANSPMQTVFSLTNEGLLPIHDVDFLCSPEYESVNRFQIKTNGGGFKFPGSGAETLSPGMKMTVPCDRLINANNVTTQSADLTISVDFRPDFVWWHLTRSFRVTAQKRNDGSWFWKRLAN